MCYTSAAPQRPGRACSLADAQEDTEGRLEAAGLMGPDHPSPGKPARSACAQVEHQQLQSAVRAARWGGELGGRPQKP